MTPWVSNKHNMGMAFNRVTWNKLRKCAGDFCSYDDYNWDWSLQHVAQSCLPLSKGVGVAPRVDSSLIVMTMRAPRVFHMGQWYPIFIHIYKKSAYSLFNNLRPFTSWITWLSRKNVLNFNHRNFYYAIIIFRAEISSYL